MFNYGVTNSIDIPNTYDDIHSDSNSPKISINGLSSSMDKTGTTTISINSDGQYPLESVDLFINNNYIKTLSSPFKFMFTPSDYGYQEGNYTMKATGTNSIKLKSTVEKSFRII